MRAEPPTARAIEHDFPRIGALGGLAFAPLPHEKFHRIEVDFATDRTSSGASKTEILFTGHRGSLVFGQAIVTVPFKHQIGTLEAPAWYNVFRRDKAKHFTIEHEQLLTATSWEEALRSATARSGRNAVLLFVHGYKNTFDDALFRAAQIAYDVHFRGAVAMFSWPSTNSVAGYMVDANNAEWSRAHFKVALRLAVDATHSSEIYIIAHSMGNQVVTRSLVELANDDPSLRGKVRELVLAAPDIDADIFKQSIAPFLPLAAQRTTLYASSHDLALEASKDLQGYRRAGDTSHGVLVIPPIQTVDASRAGGDLLGHSYVASSRTVLADIAGVIDHRSPAQRKLVRHHSGVGDYWIYEGP